METNRPKWNFTATVGLALLIVLIIAAGSFIKSLFPEENKAVTPQVSEIAFSLTQAQEKHILYLVTPFAELNAAGFDTMENADKGMLTDAAIWRLLNEENATFKINTDKSLTLTEAEVSEQYEIMYGEIADFSAYESENFSFNKELKVFYIPTGYTVDTSEVSAPIYSAAPEIFTKATKEIAILSAYAADEVVYATLSVTGENQTRKFEAAITSDGSYNLISLKEI